MATQRWSLVVTIWLLHGLLHTDSFQLTSILPNVIYACVNDNVTFNWNYTTSSGDVIVDTEWYATGHSEELVAIKTGTHFVPLPSFSHRVQFVPNAGFTLSDVIIGDSGNYSVRMSGSDASGATFSASSYVILDVSRKNELRTSDGHLHAELEKQPVYNNLTGQWSLLLTCGNFTYPTRPPFDVTWQTPSGDVIASVTYDNGVFQLLVQTGGDYTCRIPTQAVADACLTSQPEAVVMLDKTDVRLRLLEARQTQLQTENQQLKNQLADTNSHLQTQLQDTQTQLQDTQTQLQDTQTQLLNTSHELQDAKTQLQTQLQETNHQLQDTQTQLQTTNHQLQDAKTQLEQKDASLTQSIQTLTTKVSHQIGFYGRLSNTGVHSGRIPFTNDVTNYGNAFTPSTGTMTTTIAGLYFFSMTSTPTHSNVYPDAFMYKNGQNICYTHSAFGIYGQSVSCSTVQHLSVGDEVWVTSDNDLYFAGTSFSGFLIVAD